jgi:hypothetical protein
MVGSLCCFGIDGRIGQFGQGVVGLLLFGKRLIQEFDRVLQVELGSPRLERAVTRNLIVLDGLRGGEQAGIKRGLALVFVHDLLALVEDAFDGVAFLAARRFAQKFEDLLQTLDLSFGFVMMFSNAARS